MPDEGQPPAPLEVERTPAGLTLRGSQLVLDPRGRSPLGFISDARAVRLVLPERVIATAPTLALLEAVTPGISARSAALPAAYQKPFGIGPLTLSLHAAGCVLGSAWLRCEQGGKVIAWAPGLGGSGERANRNAGPREPIACDVLVLRATYGHPRYLFPPRAGEWEKLFVFVAQTLADGLTPVVLAAPLGGAQEAVQALGERGHRLRLHSSIHQAALVYEQHGVAFQDMEEFGRAPANPGEVAVIPYGARVGRRGPIGAHRAVLLSGRALEPGVADRMAVDLALPLSDHAGFDELCEIARASGARRVLTVEGHAAELAEELRARGVDALALGAERQLDLF